MIKQVRITHTKATVCEYFLFVASVMSTDTFNTSTGHSEFRYRPTFSLWVRPFSFFIVEWMCPVTNNHTRY